MVPEIAGSWTAMSPPGAVAASAVSSVASPAPLTVTHSAASNGQSWRTASSSGE